MGVHRFTTKVATSTPTTLEAVVAEQPSGGQLAGLVRQMAPVPAIGPMSLRGYLLKESAKVTMLRHWVVIRTAVVSAT